MSATDRAQDAGAVADTVRTPWSGPFMRVAGLLPYRLLAVPAARFVVERNLLLWRGQLPNLVGGVLEPLLYLLVLGVGVGGLVDGVTSGGVEVDYAVFVAPGLLATSSMNAAFFETFNTYFKLEYHLYGAMAATPASPAEIATGEVVWAVLRGGIYTLGFVAVMAALGLLVSPWAVLMVPVALLIGFAFATVTLVATTYLRSVDDFDLLELFVIPLFLFSATFYPLEVLPRWAQLATQVSPLYHGVVALRQLATGAVEVGIVGHVGVLVAIGGVGLAVGRRRFERLLRS